MSLDKWLYNFARRQIVTRLTIAGESRSIGGNTVYVLLSDGQGTVVGSNATLCYGTTVPTAGSIGFGKGCIFYKTNAAAGSSGCYINVGDENACAFALLSPVPFVPANASVTAKGATDTTVAVAEWDSLNVTNTGAGAEISLTLPLAADMIGKATRVQITVAQIVKILPQTGEKIFLGGDGVASKYLQIAGVIGNYAEIYCDGTNYLVTGYSGVLTKEG